MTLLNVTTQIIGFLCQENIFTEDNFISIKVEPKYQDIKEDLIKTALEDLVSNGVVKKIGEKNQWIMIYPPGTQGQEVSLSLPTCNWIAETINTFSKANNLEIEHVNPLNINEIHINTILEIIQDLISDEGEQ